jgi:type IV pilus assembly protein PilW
MNLKTTQWHGSRRRRQSGYTLVEIMVVMLISFIVLGGVYQAITRESIELDKEEIILDMQLNARAALDIIAGDIRKAGFLGCTGKLAADTTINTGPADPIQTMTENGVIDLDPAVTDLPIIDGLRGKGGINYLGDPLAYVNDVGPAHVTYQEGTDVLSVRYLDGDSPLLTIMTSGTTSPLDLDTNDFKRADILYITDCEFYSLFQKTNCSTTTDPAHATADSCGSETTTPVPDNSTDDLGQAYGLNARLYRLVINTYFIQDGSFAISQNTTGTDLVENIEDLQFQYKWDANGNNDLDDDPWCDDPFAADACSPAASATDIREIKIFVLAQSEQVFTYTNNNLYVYPNSPYATTPPGDHRYRYLASAVVTLRNSGL